MLSVFLKTPYVHFYLSSIYIMHFFIYLFYAFLLSCTSTGAEVMNEVVYFQLSQAVWKTVACAAHLLWHWLVNLGNY